MSTPLDSLVSHLRSTPMIRFFEKMQTRFADQHLKELQIDHVGSEREMTALGQNAVNFGFDSFLGLDQDCRVQDAVARGAREWGTQFGASRAFAMPSLEAEIETKIASWMQADAAAIFPSVTLANVGVLPGLLNPGDVLVLDEYAHNSMLEGAKIAQANGVQVLRFKHNSDRSLLQTLTEATPFRGGLIAVDGVYSMSGVVADLPGLDKVARQFNCALYVDDAHATAVLGQQGRGTVLEALGTYENAITVGCFSKACSVFGAFIAGGTPMQRLVKMRSNTYIFGGPVPPPYLQGISTVIDILQSDEYPAMQNALFKNVLFVVNGLRKLGLAVLGGVSPIVTVLVGNESETFRAGRFLFDRGFYVQSVAFPAVPYHSGILRIQVNLNHTPAALEGLLKAFKDLAQEVKFPGPDALLRKLELRESIAA